MPTGRTGEGGGKDLLYWVEYGLICFTIAAEKRWGAVNM